MSLNLNGNKLLTIGAVVFAGFALYEFTKKPSGAVSSQPGQQQRDNSLQTWLNQIGTFPNMSFSALAQSTSYSDSLFPTATPLGI